MMSPNSFASLPMDQLDAAGTKPAVDWDWHGYLTAYCDRGELPPLGPLFGG